LLDAGCRQLFADERLGQARMPPPDEREKLKESWRPQVEEFCRRIDGVRAATDSS
jgi:hypothetical protein